MILEEIAAYAVKRVAVLKQQKSLQQMEQAALQCNRETNFPFEAALKKPGISFICEVKRASPSKGMIAPEFPYLDIAKEYQEAGAAAVSVLTEPQYFLGKDEYLQEIAAQISIPVLRKDFTVDSYQIFEAKVLGASAVLLICAILEEEQLREYLNIAHSLGLSAIVEAHTEAEVEMALRAGSRIVGVNNRDLKTFEVDMSTSLRCRSLVPRDICYISESGINTPEDISKLEACGVDAVLVGESFMRSADKKAEMDYLTSQLKHQGGFND